MSEVENISVSLTGEMIADVKRAVAAGEYASSSDVMRDALRQWRIRREQRAHAVEELGRAWDKGMASDGSIDGEEAFARLRSKLQSRIPTGST